MTVHLGADASDAVARVIREWLPGQAEYLKDELQSVRQVDADTDLDRLDVELTTMRHAIRVLRIIEEEAKA